MAIVLAVAFFFIAPVLVGAVLSATGAVFTPLVTQAIIGATAGFLSGAANAALAGGDLGDVLRGGLVGAVQGAISSGPLHSMEGATSYAGKAAHVIGHGATGGAANVAMGGKFQDGFLSAAAGAAATHTGLYGKFQGSGIDKVAGRTAVAAVIGGTASALGGGKFANGAWTAAFQHLLNNEADIWVDHMKIAHSQIGVSEYSPGWNPQIKEYQVSTVKGFFNDDGTARNAWCACFVHWVLKKAGLPSLNTQGDSFNLMRARKYESYGKAARGPVHGSIGVKKSGSQYHVGFVAGVNEAGTHVIMLGGNQSNTVNYTAYPINSFTAFRVQKNAFDNRAIVVYENLNHVNNGGETR